MPCPFFMFWQWCVALCVAEGEGVAAVAADPLLAAVVPDDDDVEVVDAGVDELLVAALATAMLTPSPTPSAPAPTAAALQPHSACGMKSGVDVLPAVNGGDSFRAAHAALRWVLASAPAAARCGLTPAPQAFDLSARPAAKMFFAAFTSRSWTVSHAAQVQVRTLSGFGPSFTPHAEHTWDVGSNRPILPNVRPYCTAFSSMHRSSCDQPASETDVASRVRISALTARSSA